VGNELRTIQRAGVPFVLHALRRPEQTYFAADWARRLDEDTREIYPVPLAQLLVGFLSAPFLFRGRFFQALRNALFGERESLRARAAAAWHFLVACHWARKNRSEGISLVHSQWIHSGGTVAMYGAWLLGVPFSFTGHATDLFRDRVALVDKVKRAAFIVCISTYHREFFKTLGARDEQCHLAYCGIEVTHFAPPQRCKPREGHRILAAGRLVEKKGFKYLIEAVQILLDRGLTFDCVIAGSGPLERELRQHVEQAGLAERIEITGQALKQERIPEFMHGGDLFCLPSVWSSDNDVEGLPQLLMEAMACGLPVVSTRIAGIPDLVIEGETGLLVTPGEPGELADALQRLLGDTQLAETLAKAGRRHVLEMFDIATCLDPLIEQFRAHLPDGARTFAGYSQEIAVSRTVAGDMR
jgi:glycosyltransferase involved in cell wall biosynthesis